MVILLQHPIKSTTKIDGTPTRRTNTLTKEMTTMKKGSSGTTEIKS